MLAIDHWSLITTTMNNNMTMKIIFIMIIIIIIINITIILMILKCYSFILTTSSRLNSSNSTIYRHFLIQSPNHIFLQVMSTIKITCGFKISENESLLV